MKNSLINLSGQIDPNWVAALQLINSCTKKLEIPYVLIGAAARDLLLQANKLQPQRATRDLDLTIEVSGWNSFEEIKSCLLNHEGFERDRVEHRLIFNQLLPIDFVPFGSIETPDSSISWPPDHVIKMSVLGMKDVLETAIHIRISKEPHLLDIPVASIAGVGVLKLLAWNDRKHESTKDALDFHFLLHNYIDIGNKDSLANNHIDLFDDIDTAHARLMARDIKILCSLKTLQEVQTLLETEINAGINSQFLRDMISGYPEDSDLEKLLNLLRAMHQEL